MDWKVTVLTYNVGLRACDESNMHGLLKESIKDVHLVAIGLQEVAHAETIGSSAVSWASSIVAYMIERHKMVLLTKNYQATNQLFVFVKKALLAQIHRVDYRFAKNTLGGLTGHKGSIGVRIRLKSPLSIVFVVSHFIHDVNSYDKRVAQFKSNYSCCFPEDKSVKALFWFGDLNYRIEDNAQNVSRLLNEKQIDFLLDKKDQLNLAIRRNDAFGDFMEQKITFQPTYRLFVGKSAFDLHRTPSWCDRVLFKGEHVVGEGYDSIKTILASDHLPVCAKFSINFPIAAKSNWEVVFEHLPSWYSSLPIIARFKIDSEFYKNNSSFRDWIAILPASIDDCTSPTNWIFFATCVEQFIEDEKYYTCEFPSIPIGTYRIGYYSHAFGCFVGLSKSFNVIEQPQ